MQYLKTISKNYKMICVHLQGKPFSITVIQVYAPTSNAEEAEVGWFYEDLQDLLELTPKKDVLFIIGNWNAKVGSQETPDKCARQPHESVSCFSSAWTEQTPGHPLLQPPTTLQPFYQSQPQESATQLSVITRTSHHFLTLYYQPITSENGGKVGSV